MLCLGSDGEALWVSASCVDDYGFTGSGEKLLGTSQEESLFLCGVKLSTQSKGKSSKFLVLEWPFLTIATSCASRLSQATLISFVVVQIPGSGGVTGLRGWLGLYSRMAPGARLGGQAVWETHPGAVIFCQQVASQTFSVEPPTVLLLENWIDKSRGHRNLQKPVFWTEC